jgi:hypothetical protein
MTMRKGKDPSKDGERIVQVAAQRHFTDREEAIAAFLQHGDAPHGTPLKVLNFWGVGGIGKTALVHKLENDLGARAQPVPHALFGIESLTSHTQAYREVLLRLRSDLESQFHIGFPRFDLCLAVMLAREGGDPPPLIRLNPVFSDAFQFATALFGVPVQEAGRLAERLVRKSRSLERMVRKVGGTDDVVRLRARALQDDQTLPDELLRRFAQDLKKGLPSPEGKACRGVIFLDTYEALWAGREGTVSAQGRRLDQWVRDLADYFLHIGVLLVIAGRDRVRWDENDPDWSNLLEGHLLGGLSDHDAHEFLARCGVGPHPLDRTPLQAAIIECCDTDRGPNVSCHPLYLALCAEIVLNTREAGSEDPSPEAFRGIPTTQIARELADRFLTSLHSRPMELWVTELSLTPRFDERAALALDRERQHGVGRAGWEQVTHFSFVEPQPDGWCRLHKTMREALQGKLKPVARATVHQWFLSYWRERGELVLEWFHR